MRRLLNDVTTGLHALGLVILFGFMPVPSVTVHAQIDNQQCLACAGGGDDVWDGAPDCLDMWAQITAAEHPTDGSRGWTFIIEEAADAGPIAYNVEGWTTYFTTVSPEGQFQQNVQINCTTSWY